MKIALIRYCCWTLVFIALAAFANKPVVTGIPVGFFSYAGFPFVFLRWTRGELEWFEYDSLVLDVGIWLTLIIFAPLLLSLRFKEKTLSVDKERQA